MALPPLHLLEVQSSTPQTASSSSSEDRDTRKPSVASRPMRPMRPMRPIGVPFESASLPAFGERVLVNYGGRYKNWPALMMDRTTYLDLYTNDTDSNLQQFRSSTKQLIVYLLVENAWAYVSPSEVYAWPEQFVPDEARIREQPGYKKAIREALAYSLKQGDEVGRYVLWVAPEYSAAEPYVCKVQSVSFDHDFFYVQCVTVRGLERIERSNYSKVTWIGPAPWWFTGMPQPDPFVSRDEDVDSDVVRARSQKPFTPDVRDYEDFRLMENSRLLALRELRNEASVQRGRANAKPQMTEEQSEALNRVRSGLRPMIDFRDRRTDRSRSGPAMSVR